MGRRHGCGGGGDVFDCALLGCDLGWWDRSIGWSVVFDCSWAVTGLTTGVASAVGGRAVVGSNAGYRGCFGGRVSRSFLVLDLGLHMSLDLGLGLSFCFQEGVEFVLLFGAILLAFDHCVGYCCASCSSKERPDDFLCCIITTVGGLGGFHLEERGEGGERCRDASNH